MEFKDWISTTHNPTPDLFDNFLEMVVNELQFRESSDDTINLRAEFVLEESDAPWGKENWLDSNPKIKKTKGVKSFTKKGKNVVFVPFLINLLPAKQSGINLCVCATKNCAATCLHTAGAVQYLAAKTMARLRKTWFLALDRDKAFEQIVRQIANKKKDIDEFNRKSDKEYKKLIIRLNGTSDLIWRVLADKEGKNLFEMFPDVVFYDYSKHSKEMEHFIRGEVFDDDGNPQGRFPPNYHMTLSYGGPGGNMKDYRKTLLDGENLAVPFGPGKTASLDYMEFPKDLEDIVKKIYYPQHIKTAKEKKEYRNLIMNKIREDGNFVSKEELAPFAGHTLLPGLFMCHEVIDGDDYDARFLDDLLLPRMNRPNGSDQDPDMEVDEFERKRKKHGIVVGLTAKGDLTFSAYKGEKGWDLDWSGFMVGPSDPELNNPCRPMLNDPSKESFLKKKTEVYKKIAKAVMTIRNFDSKHVHAHEKDEQGNLRTHVLKTPNSKNPTQTYMTSKGRATREMNELIEVIQAVMRGGHPDERFSKVSKLVRAGDLARKLREYLMRPEIVEMLNSDEFRQKARSMGIDVNFDSLAKLVDLDNKRDPEGPKHTVMPSDMLRTLGRPREDLSSS